MLTYISVVMEVCVNVCILTHVFYYIKLMHDVLYLSLQVLRCMLMIEIIILLIFIYELLCCVCAVKLCMQE